MNQGIIRAHAEGIVTSTSLMVHGRAAREAVELAKSAPQLSVGLHFQLTDEGLVSLIRTTAKLYLSSHDKVVEEFKSQLDQFHSLTGSQPSHIDSHHHIHLHPQLKEYFTDIAEEYKVPVRGISAKLVKSFFGWNSMKQTRLTQISAEALITIISSLQDGVSELMCHPAFVDEALIRETKYAVEREAELGALTNPSLKILSPISKFT